MAKKPKPPGLLERHRRATELTRREEQMHLKTVAATHRIFTRAAIVNDLLKTANVYRETARIARNGLRPLGQSKKR